MAIEESRVTAGAVELVVGTKAEMVRHSHVQQQQMLQFEGVTVATEESRINAGELVTGTGESARYSHVQPVSSLELCGSTEESRINVGELVATMNYPVTASQATPSPEQPDSVPAATEDSREMVTATEAVSSPVAESSELVIGREKAFTTFGASASI